MRILLDNIDGESYLVLSFTALSLQLFFALHTYKIITQPGNVTSNCGVETGNATSNCGVETGNETSNCGIETGNATSNCGVEIGNETSNCGVETGNATIVTAQSHMMIHAHGNHSLKSRKSQLFTGFNIDVNIGIGIGAIFWLRYSLNT